MTLASCGSRPAGSKAPGQHGGFVVAVKQERGEGPRAGEKGSQEEEVSPRTAVREASVLGLEAPPWTTFEFSVAPPTVQICLLRSHPEACATPPEAYCRSQLTMPAPATAQLTSLRKMLSPGPVVPFSSANHAHITKATPTTSQPKTPVQGFPKPGRNPSP